MWAKIFKILKNKYVLASLVFLIWIIFFDENDFFTRRHINKDLKNKREQRDFYRAEIRKDSLLIHKLETDIKALEKYAREEYLMKKDNEDIFLFNSRDSSSNIQ
jgi:cell division protein FtsB